MRLNIRHIVLLMLALALLASCKKTKLIPRKELTEIVYEMLLRDQQLKGNMRAATVPDSVLVYEGIFEAHGYDTDDYLYSIEHYLRDPERFSRVFRDVAAKMEKEKARIDKEIVKRDWRMKYSGEYHMKADSVLNIICPDSLYLGNLKFAKHPDTGEFRFMPNE